jgi:flagellar motor protein MotB
MTNDVIILKQIDDYSLKLKLAQSENFLLHRKYKVADAILFEALSNYGEIPRLLDLLATSQAQQGRFTEAEAAWKKALKIQPDNLHFQNAINKIHSLNKKRFVIPNILNSLLKVAAVLFLFLMLIWISVSNVRLTTRVQEIADKQDKHLNTPASSESFNKQSPNSLLLRDIKKIQDRITGVSILQNGSVSSITFNDGLFNKGSLLKGSSKTILLKLAHALEPYSSQITIFIYGCTDNVPITTKSKYPDNTALARERAEVVANLFNSCSKWYSDNIVIGNYSEDNSPFSNKSQEDRNKNKTVVIKVSNGRPQ